MERKYKSFFDPEELFANVAEWWNTLPTKVSIGSGQHSTAYLCIDQDNTKYIIRITPVVGPQERQMLIHEIEMYKRIKLHPNFKLYISELLYADIPTVYHNIQSYDNSYFIFRYVEGLPFDTLLQSFRKTKTYMTLDAVETWGRQLLKILDFLAANKIIHRDIKPANMFVDTTHNRLVLFDFGSACFQGQDCKTYQFHGTRNYATPNSFRLLELSFNPYEYTHENDVYAVKVIMSRDVRTVVSPENIGGYTTLLDKYGLMV